MCCLPSHQPRCATRTTRHRALRGKYDEEDTESSTTLLEKGRLLQPPSSDDIESHAMIPRVRRGPPSTRVCGVVDGKGGWRFGWAAMKVKGVDEVLLLQHYACQLILYGLVIGLCFVLRRVAYFRHVRLASYISDATGVNVSDVVIRELADHFRLRDVLFELIPDRSSSPGFGLAGDLLALGVCVLAGCPLAFGASFYHRRKQQDVYAVSMLVRFLRFIAILEILRPAFYLWTSLPAPDINCILSSEEQDAKPRLILEALYVDGLVSQGCGDLNYSGHVSIAVSSNMDPLPDLTDPHPEPALW